MSDRTINFGESESEATYQIQDTDGAAGGGNFVIAKDTNANTVLLQYNPSTDAWEYAGDVDMGGGDITNANAIESTTVDSDAVGTPTIIDTEDGTNYDVGDQLVGFGDADGDGTYELPNATDGIDVESVKTEDAVIGQIESPVTSGDFDLWQFSDEDNGTVALNGIRSTDAVSTSDTEIYNSSDAPTVAQDPRSNLIHVHGRDPNAGAIHFTDVVLFLPFGEAVVIGSAGRGVNQTRDYTANGRSLELSMSSGTFDIMVSVDGLNTG